VTIVLMRKTEPRYNTIFARGKWFVRAVFGPGWPRNHPCRFQSETGPFPGELRISLPKVKPISPRYKAKTRIGATIPACGRINGKENRRHPESDVL